MFFDIYYWRVFTETEQVPSKGTYLKTFCRWVGSHHHSTGQSKGGSGQSKYFFTMFNLPPSPFITLSLLTQPFIKVFTILSLHHIIYYWSYLYEVPNFAPQSSQHGIIALLPFLSRSLGGWGTCVNLGAGVRDQGVREEEGNEAENGKNDRPGDDGTLRSV